MILSACCWRSRVGQDRVARRGKDPHGGQFGQRRKASEVAGPYKKERIYCSSRAAAGENQLTIKYSSDVGCMPPTFQEYSPTSFHEVSTCFLLALEWTIYRKAPIQVLHTRQLKANMDMNPKLRCSRISMDGQYSCCEFVPSAPHSFQLC